MSVSVSVMVIVVFPHRCGNVGTAPVRHDLSVGCASRPVRDCTPGPRSYPFPPSHLPASARVTTTLPTPGEIPLPTSHPSREKSHFLRLVRSCCWYTCSIGVGGRVWGMSTGVLGALARTSTMTVPFQGGSMPCRRRLCATGGGVLDRSSMPTVVALATVTPLKRTLAVVGVTSTPL